MEEVMNFVRAAEILKQPSKLLLPLYPYSGLLAWLTSRHLEEGIAALPSSVTALLQRKVRNLHSLCMAALRIEALCLSKSPAFSSIPPHMERIQVNRNLFSSDLSFPPWGKQLLRGLGVLIPTLEHCKVNNH